MIDHVAPEEATITSLNVVCRLDMLNAILKAALIRPVDTSSVCLPCRCPGFIPCRWV